jgi:hypothetical protein
MGRQFKIALKFYLQHHQISQLPLHHQPGQIDPRYESKININKNIQHLASNAAEIYNLPYFLYLIPSLFLTHPPLSNYYQVQKLLTRSSALYLTPSSINSFSI